MKKILKKAKNFVDSSTKLTYNTSQYLFLETEMDFNEFDRDSLTVCLNKLKKNMYKSMAEILKPYDLKNAHFMYLSLLLREGDMTLMELSKALHFDRSNTSRVIKDLIQSGYIFCGRQDDTKRKYKVGLTDEGKRLTQEIMQKMEVEKQANSAKLSKQEWNTLISLLDKLAE